MRMDGWINALTGQGMRGRDKSTHTHFEVEPVNGEEALEIWRGDPLAARIVETPPREALRQGYELQIGENDTPESYKPPDVASQPTPPITASPQARSALAAAKTDAQRAFLARHPSAFDRRIRAAITRARCDAGDAKPLQAAIMKLFERLHVDSSIREALCYRRAYGGGAILIGANDYTTDLREPLDLKKVRSLDWLTPLEARELQPLYWYNNPRAPKFGRPAIYQLIPYVIGAPVDTTISVGVTQIHESRLIIFDGVRVSRRITATATWGWGDSIFTRIKRALRAFSSGHQNAETLLADFAQAVYKIKNLADVLATEGAGGGSLADKLVAVEMARSIIRAIAIDSDEDFERKSTSLAGYPETLDRLSLWLCATSGMPATMLMGQSPAGMNATGASDIRLFYDTVATDQMLEVAPALMYLTRIGLASMGEDPDSIPHSVKFNALWQPTEKEIADAHFTQAQADAIYLDRQVVSPEEIALSRWGSDKYSPDTHLDFEARRAMEAVVPPVVDAKPKRPPPVMTPGGADPSGLAGTGDPGAIPKAATEPVDDPDEPDRMDFSPDQDRDEHGRFGAGGANPGHAEHVSARASSASAHAMGAPSVKSHEKAASAHHAAASAHEKAGNHHAAAAHEHAAEHHEHEAHSLLDFAKAGGALVVGEESASELGLEGEGKE